MRAAEPCDAKASAASVAGAIAETSEATTAIDRRRRTRSMRMTPGPCSSCDQKPTAASTPISALLAPMLRAKAVSRTPRIITSQVVENATSKVSTLAARARWASSKAA